MKRAHHLKFQTTHRQKVLILLEDLQVLKRLLKFLKYLHKAGMIGWITKGHEDINYNNKPDRLLLNNSNLAVALAEIMPEKSLIHECFMHNQLRLSHQINLSLTGNYLINLEHEFALDKPANERDRRKDQKRAYDVSSKAESASGNIIPLEL